MIKVSKILSKYREKNQNLLVKGSIPKHDQGLKNAIDSSGIDPAPLFFKMNHWTRRSFVAFLNVHYSPINNFPRQLHCAPGGADYSAPGEAHAVSLEFQWSLVRHHCHLASITIITYPLSGLDSHNNHPPLAYWIAINLSINHQLLPFGLPKMSF